MLKERGYTVLKREDGSEVELLFRTWTFKRFCELNNDLSYTDMVDLIANKMSIKNMAQMLLCASEYNHIKKKKPFEYTEVDACEWIDSVGINSAAFVSIINVMTNALIDSGATVTEDKKKAENS